MVSNLLHFYADIFDKKYDKLTIFSAGRDFEFYKKVVSFLPIEIESNYHSGELKEDLLSSENLRSTEENGHSVVVFDDCVRFYRISFVFH